MTLDLQSLALILVAGLVIGQPLSVLLRVSYATRLSHRMVRALGRKLNRERRAIGTRAARGFIVPTILMVIAALIGLCISLLPHWLMAIGLPASMASLPSYGILAAMVSPQRFLLPLWQAIGHATHNRWGNLDAPLTTLAGGHMIAPDGHGRARTMCELSIRQFMHYIGSVLWLVAAGPVGLCIYRMVQLAALHYDGRIQSFRGFHWASEKLGALTAIPAYLLGGLLLIIIGQVMAGIQPLRGLWRMARAQDGGIETAAWLAHSTHCTLGGPVQWYGRERVAVWFGSGTAKITGQHLSRIWWWLMAASLLATVMIGGLAANFQATDFQHLFNLIPADFLSFLSQKLHASPAA